MPFASGTPVAPTTLVGGLAGLPAVVGFGNSGLLPNVLGATIDLTGAAGLLTNFSWSMPRDGAITSISAYFSVTAGLSLGLGSVIITAQLYQSTTPNNIFSPVAGGLVTLPPLTGLISIGTVISGNSGPLNIPVTEGTRLLLVVSAGSTGLAIASTTAGYVSGGVNII
nr:exosporium glycoprotein BclB-related protein [Paenibacillus senegalimassiliensis]